MNLVLNYNLIEKIKINYIYIDRIYTINNVFFLLFHLFERKIYLFLFIYHIFFLTFISKKIMI